MGRLGKFRGQVEALDLLFAIIIFGVTFNIFTSFWQQTIPPSSPGFEDLLPQATRVAYELAQSPGYPVAWNQTDFKQLGLAEKPGVIDPVLFSAFIQSNYTNITTALGVSQYGLSVTLVNASSGLTIGSMSPGNANVTNNVRVSVPVVYNNTISNLVVNLWQ